MEVCILNNFHHHLRYLNLKMSFFAFFCYLGFASGFKQVFLPLLNFKGYLTLVFLSRTSPALFMWILLKKHCDLLYRLPKNYQKLLDLFLLFLEISQTQISYHASSKYHPYSIEDYYNFRSNFKNLSKNKLRNLKS